MAEIKISKLISQTFPNICINNVLQGNRQFKSYYQIILLNFGLTY